MKKLIRVFSKLFIVAGLRLPYFKGKKLHDEIILKLSKYGFKNSLDIGSGPRPCNLFNAENVSGVDIHSHDILNITQCDLAKDNLPFKNLSFDCITAIDVLEHIPRIIYTDNFLSYPFVNLMNEIWRSLKNKGYFYCYTPCFPMKSAFQDPTHVNFITEDTMNLYFCEKAWARIYGFYGSFAMIAEGWIGEHYWCIMQKNNDQEILNLSYTQK